MKGLKKKTIIKSLLLFGVFLMLFSPLYMYFSDDVAILNEEYPHLTILPDQSVQIEIRPARPKNWVSLKNISKYATGAIVLSEDWAFYQHEGLDVEQMKVALSEMMESSRFRGASTITQQMVKNVFLSESRTLWRKLHEIILSQKVEKVLSKQRILEVYLNCIEYGPGIYGIKAAAYHYFKKSPGQLSPRESAFIAMMLPSPKRYYISYKKKRLTQFAQLRVKAILKKMRMGKLIDVDQFVSESRAKFDWEK